MALASGPLLDALGALPISLTVRLGDLRPRFLAKATVGRGVRAVARNGRVLLAGDRPLAELIDQVVRLRLQPWHKAILPGDSSEVYGLLLCVRKVDAPTSYVARLASPAAEGFALAIDVGGEMILEIRPEPGAPATGYFLKTATSR
jgi:hypothetical protein